MADHFVTAGAVSKLAMCLERTITQMGYRPDWGHKWTILPTPDQAPEDRKRILISVELDEHGKLPLP
jgi:hypothetical protein